MPSTKPRRRPAVAQSLPTFIPSLVAVLVAVWIPRAYEGYALVLLLLGASLAMAATCHAIGTSCQPAFTRSALRRGAAHLIALILYTAVVFVLVAWPLAILSSTPSLGSTLGLCVALVVALVALWRLWPVFALVFEWDDAFPAGEEHSWIVAALARSIRFAEHLTRGRNLFLTHFLPAALAQLAIAFGALSLAGIGASLPDEIRTAALVLYAVAVLPLASLIIANRTVRILLEDRGQGTRLPPNASPLPPYPAAAAPLPTIAPDAAMADNQANPAPLPAQTPTAQATLDDGLLAAIRTGDATATADWLARGASPDATPRADAHDQRAALVLAAELPDTSILRTLIARGADVNRGHAGLTALLAATRSCREGRPETVTSLLANGADPARADADGNTPLHHVVLCSDATVAAILVDAGAPIEACNREHATPLVRAAAAANWPLVRFLLEHGAKPDAALPAAASISDDDPAGVQLLVQHKAPINTVDALGASALLHAAREGHVRIARALLDADANPNLTDRYGTTALMEAARTGASAIIELLAQRPIAAEAADQHGRTALLLASQSPRANADCIRALLALGADASRQGADGRSAIDQASAAGRWDLLALLDPNTPPPANQAGGNQPEPGADTPAHLLDALRFAHWRVVARFAELAQTWPQEQLATLYRELAEAADPAPRAWLLEHGLTAEAHLDNHARLLDAVLENLPASTHALRQLLEAGATPAGAGRLATALSRLDGAEGASLALDLIERGADLFGPDTDGHAPLHHASRPALLPVLRTLLARGCDPNVRDHAGATPLHFAVNADADHALAAIQALIAHGADPEAPAATGETPLGLALAHGATELEHWLRWNGWPLPKRALRAADLPAAAADPDAVARLLELGLPVDARDARGATALLRASGAGALVSVQRLLAAHADPELTVETGASPLSAAVSTRHIECIHALVTAGTSVDRRHTDEVTALMIAAALGYPDVVATLRELGARTDLVDCRGHSALHAAARFCFDSHDSLRCRRLLDALLKDTTVVEAADASGATPLLLLLGVHAKPGSDGDGTHLGALLPVLLDTGAAIAHADDHGVTALHACAMHALFEPARVLLARGADRNARDCMQRTPAELARALGYVDLALELTPRHGIAASQPTVAPLLTHPE